MPVTTSHSTLEAQMERYGEEGTNMYHSSFIITYFIESISTIFNLLFLSVIIVHYPSQEIS